MATRPALKLVRGRADGSVPAASPRAQGGNIQRIAAIDIGSNSVRSIVADVSPSGEIRILNEMKAAPRLGGGLTKDGSMNEAAMEHAIEEIGRMATLATQLGARRVDTVATSAVRAATNAPEFLRRVRDRTGLRVRVLTGEEEAKLAFRSAVGHFELGSGRAVVLDIGGGSLEVALSADGLLERLASFPFGAIRLTEKYLGEAPRPRDIEGLRKDIRPTLRKMLPVRDWRGATIIGSGGTFTNLAGIHLARRGLKPRTVHGTRIPRAEVLHILEWLANLTPAQRAGVPGLNPARADIIVAGLAVIAEVLSRVEASEVVVSGFGIREGLLLEGARVRTQVADPGEARARSVRAFAERCRFEAPHAEQVQRLALQLFDAMGKRLGATLEERDLLADAALLHDVGYHISYDKHHKHSYHLILHADLLGLSPEEQVTVAHVARYHRGADPDRLKHGEYGQLQRDARRRIKRLAAILRVADGFDRGHVGAVERLKVRWLERAVRITPVPRRGATTLQLELWGAARKTSLLAEVAGVPVEIVAPDGSVVRDGDPTRAPAGEP